MFARLATGLLAQILLACTLVACGGGGGGSGATTGTSVPTITSHPTSLTVSAGDTATFSVTATGTNPLTYQWKKNGIDISGATNSTYITPATTPVDDSSNFTVAVSSGTGAATSNNATLTVNPLRAACSGASCGASGSDSYNGSGIGVWQYQNTGAAETSVNLRVTGISAGKQVTLAFSNGQETPATSLPDTGSDASSNAGPLVMGNMSIRPQFVTQHEDAHGHILALNKETVRLLKASQRNSVPATQNMVTPTEATPAVGAARNWLESGFTNSSYATTNKYVCVLPTGRNVVFWKANSDTQLTDGILSQFVVAVCGVGKGFDKLTGLIGDAWGSHTYAGQLIQDTSNAKQDINIVFLEASTSSKWAGYFWSRNNILSTVTGFSNSNQALVFFVNTNGIADDVNFYISTLIHEAKHMIGFYQEAIVRGKSVDTWYEESSAMMAEDIVGDAITGVNKIAQYRIPYYISTGGNVSLNNWPELSSAHYAMGGAFGAFLNRRYGTNLFTQSVSGCSSGMAQNSSYACLDTLIKAAGGSGIADEFSRMGASVFSSAPATGLPAGHGYPQVISNGYTLSAIDLSAQAPYASAAMSAYTSMTQSQLRQTMGPNVSLFKRNNVKVPGNTSLYLVIQ